MEIHRGVNLEWSGVDNTGTIETAAGKMPYSTLDQAGAAGPGDGPEFLLMAAIASDYSITLSNLLGAAALPRTRVAVRADAVIANDHGKTCFTSIVIKPTILGADLPLQNAYNKAAVAARDECLIGRSVRGNIALVIGDVSLTAQAAPVRRSPD